MFRSLSSIIATLFALSLITLYAFSLGALLFFPQAESLWNWTDIFLILKISLMQASLSATLSLLLGLLLARAFFYLQFRGKKILRQLLLFSWALPSLIVIFAVINVWGNAGWLATWLALFGFNTPFPLYGMMGILLAHLLLNIPLATQYVLEGLSLIPENQYRLAGQLQLQGWALFRIVEFPSLKGALLYAFANIFLLCFTSFPIVLMLGGSPKYSTLEVAIYQAVTFEFDFTKAIRLIAVQLLIGIVLDLLMDKCHSFKHSRATQTQIDRVWLPLPQGWHKISLIGSLSGIGLFLLLPMLSIFISGLQVSQLSQKITSLELWQATFTSLGLSLISATTVVLIAYGLALEIRRLRFQQRHHLANVLTSLISLPLMIPVFALAVGLFLLLIEKELSQIELLFLVGFCNGLPLLPYVYRLIFSAMWQSLTQYDKLAQSLALTGFARWRIVELPYLIRPLCNAFLLAMSASFGSFAVIAFFGAELTALPYLLYQQIGSYRTEEAAVTALFLLILTAIPFSLMKSTQRR